MLFYSQRWDNSYQLANSPSRSLISNIRTTFVFIFSPKYIHDKKFFQMSLDLNPGNILFYYENLINLETQFIWTKSGRGKL